MYIYRHYKTREEIEKDYNNGKLKQDYIFVYDRRLYVVIDSHFTFYKPLNPVIFKNRWEQDHIVKQYNLLWYQNDVVININQLEEEPICCVHA